MAATALPTRPNRPWMPRRHASQTVLAAAVLAVVVSPAWANPGTAMAITVGMYLVIGNFVIGAVEWIGLSMLGASKLRAAVMIPANYISAWIGVYVVSVIPTDRLLQGESLLTNALPLSWAVLIGLVLLGVLIELPFIAFAFRPPRRWKRIVAAGVLVNAVTGAGVVLWYVKNSNMSLVTDYRVAPPSVTAGDLDAWVYLIDEDLSAIRRIRIDGTRSETIAEIPAVPRRYQHNGGRLWLVLRPGEDDRLDLCIALQSGWIGGDSIADLTPENGWHADSAGHASKIVVRGVGNAGSLWYEWSDEPTIPAHARNAADLRASGHDGPVVEQSLSPWAPIRVRPIDGKVERLGLMNAMLGTSATAQTATVLPGDRLVFALAGAEAPGTRGVFIASLRDKTIAYLAQGRSPVVVLDAAPAE